jgi:uncharacterized membrane-anchored protein
MDDILKLSIQNGPWCLLSGIALYTFYKYVQTKDVEKEKDKKELKVIYSDMVNKYIERENKYIEIINIYGADLKIIKQDVADIKNKIGS